MLSLKLLMLLLSMVSYFGFPTTSWCYLFIIECTFRLPVISPVVTAELLVTVLTVFPYLYTKEKVLEYLITKVESPLELLCDQKVSSPAVYRVLLCKTGLHTTSDLLKKFIASPWHVFGSVWESNLVRSWLSLWLSKERHKLPSPLWANPNRGNVTTSWKSSCAVWWKAHCSVCVKM